MNSRITHHHSVASLASSSKSIWLSVDYRLSPEVQFPVNYIDCKSVVEWTLTNRDTISSLGAKVGVSGDSSGGHFAALISHEIPNEIDFQILVYPVVDLGKFYPHSSITKLTLIYLFLSKRKRKTTLMSLIKNLRKTVIYWSPL